MPYTPSPQKNMHDEDFTLTLSMSASYNSGGGWSLSGSTAQGEPIPIGSALTAIANKFSITIADIPTELQTLEIQNVSISLADSSTNSTFSLGFEALFQVAGTAVSSTAAMSFTSGQNGAITIDWQLQIGNAIFDLTLDDSGGSLTVSGILSSENDSPPLAVSDLLSTFGITDFVIPSELDVSFKSASFSYSYANATTEVSFTVVTAGEDMITATVLKNASGMLLVIDLPQFMPTSFPVIGSSLNNVGHFSLSPGLIISNADMTAITISLDNNNITLTNQTINHGIQLIGQLQVGVAPQNFLLPLYTIGTPAPPPSFNPPIPPIPSPDGGPGTQISVERSLGPIYISQIGLGYKNSEIKVTLSFSLITGPVTIGLQGFGFGFPLSTYIPNDPTLDGLLLGLHTGGIQMEGGFSSNPSPPVGVSAEYSGTAVVTVSAWSLSAMGSYATTTSGEKSLFLFALLKEFLGGPPFFTVTGLTGGFAYNRGLTIPTLADMATFPFVAEVLAQGQGPFDQNPTADGAMTVLDTGGWVPIEEGQYWLSAGVTFTSYELLNSYVMLVILFDTEVEIVLLGYSVLSIPAATTNNPLAYACLAIEASYVPSVGTLQVTGALTPESYIFDPQCHLQGGFAFYTWLKGSDAGDFVVTLGGYNPCFPLSSYPNYPAVTAVGVSWSLPDTNISVKGSVYYALIPSMFMAGGSLQASFCVGPVSVYCDAAADFLIAWKPFYYSADVTISVGLSIRIDLLFFSFTLSVSIDANLSLWGPDFSGTIHVDIWFASFSIHIGQTAPQTATPILWSDFKNSFLPSSGVYGTMQASQGLLSSASTDSSCHASEMKATDNSYDWSMNPEYFVVTLYSVVPITSMVLNGATPVAVGKAIGVYPCGQTSENITSTCTITLNYFNSSGEYVPFTDSTITFTPLTDNSPSALWGDAQATVTTPTTIQGTAKGYVIASMIPSVAESSAIPIKVLLTEHTDSFSIPWNVASYPTSDTFDQTEQVATTFMNSNVVTTRTNTIAALIAGGLNISTPQNLTNFGTGATGFTTLLSYRHIGEVI